MATDNKRVRKLIRHHAGLAWEAEMRAALEPLASKFHEWRSGAMSSGELHDAIHEYHDGIGREIWKRFATNKPEMPLARSVAVGFVPRESLPREVFARIESLVEMFEKLEQDE